MKKQGKNQNQLFKEMRRRVLGVGLIIFLAAISFGLVKGYATTSIAQSQTYHSELEYLKAMNSARPADDPEIIFLLVAQYLNANQYVAGIEFFKSFLDKYESRLLPRQKALYLAALGLLRASYANEVSLLKRIGWVNETIDILETARKFSNNEDFVIRWSTGVVYAQLPDRFNKKDAAIEDLKWCVENISKAPNYGWLREVYYHLALIHHKAKDHQQAEEFLKLSGYDNFDKQITLTTPYAVNARKGHTFSPRQLKEVIPGRVFALSGFEFTEFYFIVSQDRRELVAIDAGTRPDSAQAAYEHLKKQYPELPPLTTVFVTHAHWDHIGGHLYFRRLNPSVKFYARENYHEEVDRAINAPVNFQYFFGTDFKRDFLIGFQPDITVAQRRKVDVGGTLFELIPISGGETPDGMFIYLPEHSVLFVGDFIMPYIGAPFLEEGNIPGLFQAMDLVIDLNPKHLLHGHEPLTRIFRSTAIVDNLKKHLEWLYQETLKAIRNGADRATLHHQNLIPPSLFQNPDVQVQPYLVIRENFINRLYDQEVGYWQPDLQGMDHLSQKELSSVLTYYLELSEEQLAKAIEKMVNNGDHELAARTVTGALTQYPDSKELAGLKEKTFMKLKEKYQEFNPFKFIIYSELIRNETPQLEYPRM